MRINCKPTPRVAGGRPVGSDVDALAATILEACAKPPREVFLFGSGAREELTATSDLDFGVVARRGYADPEELQRDIQKALPKDRAVDVVVTDSERMKARAADPLSWERPAMQEGIVLFKAKQIPYDRARLLAEWPAPGVLPAPTCAFTDAAHRYNQAAWQDLRDAMDLASRTERVIDELRGPPERHRICWLSSRAAWHKLVEKVLLNGFWPDPGHSLADIRKTLAAHGGPGVKIPPATAVQRLRKRRRKWTFQGEALPTIRQMLQAVDDANTVFDHLPEDDLSHEMRDELKRRLDPLRKANAAGRGAGNTASPGTR